MSFGLPSSEAFSYSQISGIRDENVSSYPQNGGLFPLEECQKLAKYIEHYEGIL